MSVVYLSKNLSSTGLLLGAWLCTFHVLAQSPCEVLQPGYYTVVATYRVGQEGYAHRYINALSAKEQYPQCGIDVKKKYLYVYLGHYTDFDESIAAMRSLRQDSQFTTAWVRIIGDLPTKTPYKKAVIHETPPPPDVMRQEQSADLDAGLEHIAESREETNKKEQDSLNTPQEVVKPRDTVMFRLYHQGTEVAIDGEIEIIDGERLNHMATVVANTYTLLPELDNTSGELTLKVNVFGYKPQHVDINVNDMERPFITRQEGHHYLINFYLTRYQKGDMYPMDNVYFYSNAAIMLPGSQSQINQLLAMMNDNPNYNIRLHGHTNGKLAGKLITMGPSNLFFELADDVTERFGSAKQLSRARALTIKKWLVEQGIAPPRIKIKAWGGTKMLYDQNRSSAYKNLRVEVEILTQ